MEQSDRLFLAALRAAIRGETFTPPGDGKAWRGAMRLAAGHSVLPLLTEAVCAAHGGADFCRGFFPMAKRLTCAQAQRTADFLLLYASLCERGLRPAVMKGIVLRDMYPQPEQRASTDEDLFIRTEDFPACHRAMLDNGLTLVNPDEDPFISYEVAYADQSRGLYIEVHKQLFSPSSDAYADLNELFGDTLDRCEPIRIYGQDLMTLAPTDHLLYMLCHAFKHFLHGGFGIRQVCDIGMFADRYADRIDWDRIRTACEGIRIECLAAAVFRIGERHLGLSVPLVFEESDVDEAPLLEDILIGGLYGVNDINRAHSSNITLEARATGRRGGGILSALFPSADFLQNSFPYAKKYPILTPVAWANRILLFLQRSAKGTGVSASESVRIGRERVRLLERYGII